MAWIKLDRCYSITTTQPKDNIVNIIKERIEKAHTETGWFNFKNINYKKVQVDNYRAIIKRDPILFSQIGGIGVIILNFNSNGGVTQINAVVKPVKNLIGFYFLLGFLILFSGFVIWLIPGTDKFFFIAFAWIVSLCPGYVTIILYRYRLKKYLELVLEDIDIRGDLVREK